ncbi:protein of unknown function [Mucilaginibacter mallensis]|uniref:DUF4397 domain-containing protein n=1 Tax=Mucilaginibacter mallensis TaxID=652787 RepID=A0A1H2CC19_MUCMA|nr:DUF4397 domain-containing protein [Mucilaginibacter mallensis]SDT67782.1 protein of unknown function [Mucilaginibacter mallensis]
MKSSKKLKSVLAGVGFVSLLSIMLLSCLKDHNTYVTVPTAQLMVVQGSPDAPAEILYLNTNRVTSQPYNYGDWVGYFNAYTGTRQVVLYNYASQSVIVSDTIGLKQGVAYSLFLGNTYTKPDFILLKDTISQPASGKASIRFVDVSPDAGAVDLSANNTVLVSNKTYKGASSFLPVNGNNTTYSFQVLKSGTSTVLATLSNITIQNGQVYTVWLHGLAAGTGTAALKADIITNASY